MILYFFAFLAGLVTVLSPCILPVLPIMLSGITGGKSRPIGIVSGFFVSFVLFTLFSFALVQSLGLSADTLRNTAMGLLFVFGASLCIPQLQDIFKKMMQYLPLPKTNLPKQGFLGGFGVGMTLGLIWTPCVGPILSSVITLAASSSLTGQAVLLTLLYTLGTCIPMFALIYGGRSMIAKSKKMLQYASQIQKSFGVLMMILAVLMWYGVDRDIQAWIVQSFPNFTEFLSTIDDIDTVKNELKR